MEKPLYRIARDKLDAGEDISGFLFEFHSCDAEGIWKLSQALRSLLKREDISANQIWSIGKALLGLQRLPLTTPGLDVEIGLYIDDEDGAECNAVLISEDRFEISSGGHIRGPFGSDSFSKAPFTVERGARTPREFSFPYDLEDNFCIFAQSANIRINDNSKDHLLDWTNDDGSIFWEWIFETANN